MIIKNPCKTSLVRSSVSPPEYKEQRFLTKDELNWLSDCINPQYKELILFAGLTGLRKGEKVSEKLFYEKEKIKKTPIPGILHTNDKLYEIDTSSY